MIDGLLEILATLDRHRFRSALTALAVAWGIFMLVVLLSAGVGLERGVRWEFRDDAINSVWIFRGRTTKPWMGHPRGRGIRFTNADYERIKELPGVEHITARYFLWGDFSISWQGRTGSFQVRSCHPDHQHLEGTIITRGRFIHDRDLDSRAKVTVIGEEVSKHLFQGRDPVGEWVDIKGISYRVVGVFRDDGGLGELQKVYIPITTAQAAYGGGDTVHMLMFTVGDMTVAQSQDLVDTVRRQMASVHHFDPTDVRALRIRNNLERFQEFASVLSMIRLFSWIVGLGTIAAGVVGVGNIMLVSVAERTSEIGLRKALGATPLSVVGQIVAEAVLLTSVAGYGGLVAGLIVVELVDRLLPAAEMFRNPEVDLGVAFGAVGVLVAAGLISGLVPAWRAARVDPVVALREGGGLMELWIEVWATMRRSPLRTLLTAGGVAWGMFMLLVMLGFGEALEDMAVRNMAGQATNSVWIWGGRTSRPFLGQRPGRRISYNNADIEALSEELTGLEVIAPRVQLGGWRSANSVTANGKGGEYHVMGDHPEIFDVIILDLAAGRLINPLDLQEQRKIAVVGEQIQTELYGGRSAVGQQIAVRGVQFTVVGVVRSTRADERGDRDNNTVFVPFNTFQRAFNFGDSVGWFALIAEDGVLASDLEEQARGVLASRHSIHPDDRNAVGSHNTHEDYLRIKNLFTGIRAFVWIVGAATLLTGVVGVSNIMLIIVRERTSEIGLRRALGATQLSVMWMVVVESLVLTIVAGYVGLLGGIVLVETAAVFIGPDNESMGVPQVGVGAAAIAVAVLVVAGVLAGLLPARRAAQINPVVALRTE